MVKVCVFCKEEKDEKKFGMSFDRGYRRSICEQCRDKKRKARARFKFLQAFGFKCQCCGENDIRFLTIDHVQNDGYKDEHLSPMQLYRKAEEEKYDHTRWNCLCWNCNCGRGVNKGICPHKDPKDTETFLQDFNQLAEELPHNQGVRPKTYITDEQKEIQRKLALSKYKLKKIAKEMLKLGMTDLDKIPLK